MDESTGVDYQPGETMTFETLRSEVGRISEPHLNQWQPRLEQKIKEESPLINRYLRNLSALYGQPAPDHIRIALQWYPTLGTQKGEPINNLADTGKLPESIADILEWISDPCVHPTDSEEKVANIYEEYSAQAVRYLLHETQHRYFQSSKYKTLIAQAENLPEVIQIMKKMGNLKGDDYVEATNEAITCYLETYYQHLSPSGLNNGPDEPTPLVIFHDPRTSGLVAEAVIKEDVEKFHKRGPYTHLRQSWEHALGSLPIGYETARGEIDLTQHESDHTFTGVKLYELVRTLDTDLVEGYLINHRAIDVNFIVRLYQKIEEKI